ncbi:MAG: hypothetical protein DRH08_03645 [Deltaproteobacteria bacterium]|nr:MAG: hypothetical protein DRH08_03645 [Deltaproteobacteria bacterium]
MDALQFSIWKRAIFRKVKEINHLSGGVVLYAAQSNVQIDAEIAEKGRFRMKTNYEATAPRCCYRKRACAIEVYAC